MAEPQPGAHALHKLDPTFPPPTVPQSATQAPVPTTTSDGVQGTGNAVAVGNTGGALELVCGPLLNYKRTSNGTTDSPTWHGSVLIVTKPGGPHPELQLRCLGPVDNRNAAPNDSGSGQSRSFTGEKLYQDPHKVFWRFVIDAPIQAFEASWEYHIPGLRVLADSGRRDPSTRSFVITSLTQSFRIMFHSCNGFSVGTDMDAWKGPLLWNDVLRLHGEKPFHVMIGGGDQIYNDGVRVDGPLREWTDVSNPVKRRHYPFNEDMRQRCDDYYFNNYVRWYNTEPFATANSQIPQINIWDDHDIIDGFGSYTDHFMRCAVFRGIGGVAHKMYLLFQHHVAPPKSTFTTDAPATFHQDGNGETPADSVQLKDTFVMDEKEQDSSFIIGQKPGPYVEERSRNIYCQLGARIAFVGIDARTERTRHQINYPETYDLIFNRVASELSANKNIKHLILLLGVPIAYPRLQWLENILSSPLIAPIRLLNKRFGIAGGLFNNFDGNADLLDDLDDHYTAHQHKTERRDLIHRLQEIAKKHSVRVSILGGDVHLAAVGRFYSNPKLGIPAERDWRYMPNIISSAITNKPPPAAVANLLARRNKIHHLDHDTDETLLEIFDRDPGRAPNSNGNATNETTNGEVVETDGHHHHFTKKKTADKNHATMPSRNFAIIHESHAAPAANGTNPAPGQLAHSENQSSPPDPKANPRHPIHAGEEKAGTQHPAASGLVDSGLCGHYGLDVTIRVEIDPKNNTGNTEGYGFSIPGLSAEGYAQMGTTW